jgi:tetratricopeptide (TPR) repeat protein
MQADIGSGIAEPGHRGARSLKPGKLIQQKLSGSEMHGYQIALAAGRYTQVVIDQSGIDLAIRLLGPDGQPLAEFRNLEYRPTRVSHIARASGIYLLEVSSKEKGATAGRYEVRLEETREATSEDRSRINAEKAFADAEQLRAEWAEESLRKAIKKYEEAESSWQAAGDQREVAYSLNRMGEVYYYLSEYQKTLEYCQRALSLSRTAGDHRGEIEALNNVGYVYAYWGEIGKALEYYQQAILLSQNTGDRRGEAQTLNNIGEAHYNLSEAPKALEFFYQALPLWQTVNYRRGQALTLRNIGYIYTEYTRV